MQDVLKIVRDRLQAARPAANLASANHPDADALTAFAEQSLPERERAVVLEHLARCGDCRDIVALALPATEPVETATKPPARGWLTWPALRWGLVAAGVVAIASVGIVRYERRLEKMASKSPTRVEVAANEPVNRTVADQISNQAKEKSLAPPFSNALVEKAENLPGPSALADSVSAGDSSVYDKKRAYRPIAPQVPAAQPRPETLHGAAPVVGGPLPHGPRLANSWQQSQQNALQNQNQVSAPGVSSPFAKQQAAGDLTANLRVPAPSVPLQVETQSAQLETKGKNSDALKDLPPAPQRQNEEYASARIGKAKPVVTAQTASGGVLAGTAPAQSNAGPIGGPMLPSSAPVPRWTISSTGSLQRSFDQGFTWQVVNVNAPPAYLLDATAMQTSEKTSRAKTKDNGKAFKRDDSSPIFRAVAATGADVWAGGSGGALYHSPDAGNHWTRVTPSFSGVMLTGDIVSLEFPDTQHGKVSTSTDEIWTTSDAGQTWQKQ
jgi:photosynthesis system II assembly factor YCF48-like protein/putative zinc finger protein